MFVVVLVSWCNLSRFRALRQYPEKTLRENAQYAQQVFDRLYKVYGDLVRWVESNIWVRNDVVIQPPFRPENCEVNTKLNPASLQKAKQFHAAVLDHLQGLVNKSG